MTLIAAYTDSNGVHMIGDSYFGVPDSGLSLISDKSKVFKRFLSNKMEIGIGCCGSTKIENVLHYDFEFPKTSKYETSEEYIVSTFRKALTQTLKEHDCFGGEGRLVGDSEFLVAYDGRIYGYEVDGSISMAGKNYRAIGAGSDFAIGIFEYNTVFDGRKEKVSSHNYSTNPEQTFLEHICSCVSNCNSMVHAPFHYLFIKKDK